MAMNSNSKKDKDNKSLPKVEESPAVYQSKVDLGSEISDDDWHSMPEILHKLIEKGIKQCEDGELIPHEKVMNDIKKKFNIS